MKKKPIILCAVGIILTFSLLLTSKYILFAHGFDPNSIPDTDKLRPRVISDQIWRTGGYTFRNGVVVIDDCEYITFWAGSITGMSHKGNCTNSFHSNTANRLENKKQNATNDN